MKLTLSALMLCFTTFIFSQDILSTVRGQNASWLGVDFSIGKFVGASGFTHPSKIKNHYMPIWNSILLSERRIDILEKGLKLESITFNTDNIRANNEKIEMDDYIQEKEHNISKSDIQKLIESYDYSEIQEPLCISIVVESFNKLQEIGEVWMVFNFRNANSLFLKKLELKPGGIGFRRYWQTVLLEAIVTTDKKHKKWLKGKG